MTTEKRRRAAALLSLCLLFGGCAGENGPAEPAETSAGSEIGTAAETEGETKMETEVPREETTAERAARMRKELWDAYCERERQNEERKAEDEKKAIRYGDVTMKYGLKTVGKPDENGLYPLYIALHGGGSDETGKINDSQWQMMAEYYLEGVKNGVYVNPRAVRDTWDCHSNPESYPLYDRLIENMILFHSVDPNRVYILGFSAGGDGVYQITPRMTDRFAAANMSAGHPNGVKLENLYDMPLQLQVGIEDAAYNRNKVTAEYDLLLGKLHNKYGGGYEHRTNIHTGHAHNFADYDDKEHEVVEDPNTFFKRGEYTTVKRVTSALRFLDQYTREPLPEKIVWNLAVRADKRETESFYWLSAPKKLTKGIITAVCDRETNTVTVTTDGQVGGDFDILLSAAMLDFDRPVTVTVDGETREITPAIRQEIMEETLEDRGDPSYIFEDRISTGEIKNGN